jgi:hypothetical protein
MCRELVDMKKRTGIVGNAFTAMLGRNTKVKDTYFGMEDYETLVFDCFCWGRTCSQQRTSS